MDLLKKKSRFLVKFNEILSESDHRLDCDAKYDNTIREVKEAETAKKIVFSTVD